MTKKLLLSTMLLLAGGALMADNDGIDYRLSWTGNGIRVRVEMASAADTVRFDYGDEGAGGLTEQLSWLRDVEACRGGLTVDSLHHAFLLCPDRGRLAFAYTVCHRVVDATGGHGCIRDMFSPDIDSAMLYTATYNLFARPRTDDDLPVAVAWDSTPDFPVFCLYNPGRGTEPFAGRLGEIVSSVVVGDPLLRVDTVVVGGRCNFLVTAIRKDRDMNLRDLTAFMRQLYGSATRFWGDPMATPYSLVIFPFRTNTFEVSGNGYDNGFLSRYDASCDTILTLGRRDVYAHEIGHKWIGSGPFWFGEGFNEMQTAYLLVDSRLDAPEYFATYLNVALKGLANNPHRHAADSVAEKHFWDDGMYIWLLYWRGFSYAFYLAGETEHHTGCRNAYRTMMEALRPDIGDMTAEKFLADMAPLVGRRRLRRSFEQYIVEGRDIDFGKAHLPSGCEIFYLPSGELQLRVTDASAFAAHFE